MPKLPLYNQTGESVGTVEANDKIFGKPKFRTDTDVVHQVVVAQEANARRPIAHTKTRGEVRGGGKKPWKQKGTGRARAGSIRSPLWRGGGVTFGPRKNRNFAKKVNRQMKRLAMSLVFSELAGEKRLFVIDNMEIAKPKTRELFEKIENLRAKLGLGRKVLLLVPERQEALLKAARNIVNLELKDARNVNIIDLLRANSVVMTKDSLPAVEKLYAP